MPSNSHRPNVRVSSDPNPVEKPVAVARIGGSWVRFVRELFAAQAPSDGLLTSIVFVLVAFGVVMVYSASAVYAKQTFHSSEFFLIRQASFAVLGLGAAVVLSRVDYRRLRALTYPVLFVVVGLMLFVALGFGTRAGGAARWIRLGPIGVQPAEVAKLAVIAWLAYSLSRKTESIRSFSVGFLPHVLVAGVLMLLCLKQPDFGSAVMIGLLTFVMLFVAGARTGYILGVALMAAPVVYALVMLNPYRAKRVQAFLDPFAHRYDIGYQVVESLLSFGAGGVHGVGLGDSKQKLFFLPEAHNDFIGAIIGEELGLVGIIGVVVVFATFLVRGYRVAMNAPDEYGRYLAVGITSFVGLQAFTNLAVATGMLPTKGLNLPFLSYGGTSLLVNCMAVGVLLNISRGVREPLPETASNDQSTQRNLMHHGASA